MAHAKKTAKRSLAQFVKDDKRTLCPLCHLPQAVQQEIMSASGRTATAPIIIAWLEAEHGVKVTMEQFVAHARGGHGWLGKDGKRHSRQR
jgi:hypothetical protein